MGAQERRDIAVPWAVVAAVVAVAVALRLYLVLQTLHQPVWWDESEYLLEARHIALGTPDTGFFTGRATVFPFLLSAFFAVGLGETTVRLVLALASGACVLLVYRVGARLVGSLAAVVAAIIFAGFYVPVFFGSRVMTEIPHLALFLLGLDLWLATTPRRRFFALPVFALAVLVRFPDAIVVIAVVLFTIVSERGRILKDRIFWLSAAAALLVTLPYFVWSAIAYGDPFHAMHGSSYLMPDLSLGERLAGLGLVASWATESVGRIELGITAVGLVLSFVVGNRRAAAFLVVWVLAHTLYFALFVRPIADAVDRYLILCYPPLFLWTGVAIAAVARRIPGRWPLPIGLVGALAMAIPYAVTAETKVIGRRTSYRLVREAGLWLRDHASPTDGVMTTSVAQITYYSEHAARGLPKSREDLAGLLAADPKLRYLVLVASENPPEFLRAEIASLGMKSVVFFPNDPRRVQVWILERL